MEGEALEEGILSAEAEGVMVELAETFIRERLPERNKNVEIINRAADRIVADRRTTKVDDVARRLHLSKRTLQRIFGRYVGVGPKWVIRRCRLHEAADRLADGEAVDRAELALDLGYSDQAHFIIRLQSDRRYASGGIRKECRLRRVAAEDVDEAQLDKSKLHVYCRAEAQLYHNLNLYSNA